MPQLNPEFFLSQIFWLVTTFSFLLFFLWRISLPRISQVLEKREIKINEDIKSAKKLQTEAEEIQSKIDQQLNNIYKQTSDLIKKSNTDLQNKILIELETIDKEIKKTQEIIEGSQILSQPNQTNVKEKDIKKFVIENNIPTDGDRRKNST